MLGVIGNAIGNMMLFALHIDSKTVFPKPLSKSEEEECFKKMSEGDNEARCRLIEHNLRLVAHIIKKYYANMKDQDELISIGTVGLIKAVSTFDYRKGNRFATYASRCIENAKVSQRLLLFKIKIMRKMICLQKDENWIIGYCITVMTEYSYIGIMYTL